MHVTIIGPPTSGNFQGHLARLQLVSKNKLGTHLTSSPVLTCRAEPACCSLEKQGWSIAIFCTVSRPRPTGEQPFRSRSFWRSAAVTECCAECCARCFAAQLYTGCHCGQAPLIGRFAQVARPSKTGSETWSRIMYGLLLLNPQAHHLHSNGEFQLLTMQYTAECSTFIGHSHRRHYAASNDRNALALSFAITTQIASTSCSQLSNSSVFL